MLGAEDTRTQSRRKRFSFVKRQSGSVEQDPSGSPISFSPAPTAPDQRNAHGPADVCHDLLREIIQVVDRAPGSTSQNSRPKESLHKSSVYAMYQDNQSSGDKIDMRLIASNEKERSDVMHKIVDAFQHKVRVCADSFKPALFLKCLRIITSISTLKPIPKTPHKQQIRTGFDHPRVTKQTDPFAELDIREAMSRDLPNFTIARLRTTVQQILRRATLRQDGTVHFPGAPVDDVATKSVQYFIWLFEFMDFLQELFTTFVEKIFTPLFKFFHDAHLLSSSGRTKTLSSTFSKFGHFVERCSSKLSDGEAQEMTEETERLKEQAKESLLQLGQDYSDIKAVYDTTEIDKIAQRLSFVKEQLEYLLEEEDEVDPELYSEKSGKMVQHLDMDSGTENLIRLIPDLIVKLEKASWLAKRWLDLDDQRTKDVKEKLKKILAIEETLVRRLNVLYKDISCGEKTLEEKTNELSDLLDRECRSDQLTMETYSLDSHIHKLQDELKLLVEERDSFAPKLKEIVEGKNLAEYYKLKFRFEANKLKRFVVERKLATLNYQHNLLSEDINVELYIKPSVTHSTNRLQDDCEQLEQTLREKQCEAVGIRRALIPIQEDKATLVLRVNRDEESNTLGQLRGLNFDKSLSGNAVYIRSFPKTEAPVRTVNASNSKPGPTVHSRRFLLKRFPVGNNRALRIHSPPVW